MNSLKELISNFLSVGKYFFTKEDVLRELLLNPSQFRQQAYRLAQKKLIKKLTNNFYVIITPEFRNFGSLPMHWIIDPLMKHLNQDYYISLLSAASMYGATEQQPMISQVITNKPTKNIILGRDKIEFHVFKYCSTSDKTSLNVPTGYAQISTKEQTMLDLIRFYNVAGHLSNVASIIKILAEECDPVALAKIIEKEKTNPVLQRLGYILELTNFSNLANIVALELKKRKPKYVPLKPDVSEKTGEKLKRWKLTLNDTLELE